MTFIGTIDNFKALPGVLEVKPATPTPGCVTLVVEPGYERYADTTGEGTGSYPIGMLVLTETRAR